MLSISATPAKHASAAREINHGSKLLKGGADMETDLHIALDKIGKDTF